MEITEKAKEKLDNAGKEIKLAVENLGIEVGELTEKVKGKLKGTGEEMKETAEELTREIKNLSERVKELIPKSRKRSELPVSVDRYPEFVPKVWDQPFQEFRRARDRLFDDFFQGSRWPMAQWRSPLELTTDMVSADWLRVDMSETDDKIQIVAELPGVAKDQIDISVSDDRVTIRGEKKEQEEKRARGYYRLERSYGSFQRSFSLPCEIESEKVEASFKDGLLIVSLPKSAAARERIKKIPVRTI